MPALSPAPSLIELHRYRPEDSAATLEAFRQAVHRGARDFYSQPELDAWAPAGMDEAAWKAARAGPSTWVAELRGEVVAFCGVTPEGHVDMLYVRPDHTRRGLGAALLNEGERSVRDAGVLVMTAYVSLAARTVFMRAGYNALRSEIVERRGQNLVRFVMEKVLKPV